MTANELIFEARQLGIVLVPDGTSLRFWPKAAMPEELAAKMASHKEEVLRELASHPVERDEQINLVDGGPKIRSSHSMDPAAAWQATLDALTGDPEFPADVLSALRTTEVHWANAA